MRFIKYCNTCYGWWFGIYGAANAKKIRQCERV